MAPSDAEDLARAVAESQEHLRPWMPWIAGEPKTLDQCRARIPEWDHEWAKGRDFVLGVFIGERVASRKLVDRFDGNIAAQRLPTLPLDDERGSESPLRRRRQPAVGRRPTAALPSMADCRGALSQRGPRRGVPQRKGCGCRRRAHLAVRKPRPPG